MPQPDLSPWTTRSPDSSQGNVAYETEVSYTLCNLRMGPFLLMMCTYALL